MKYYLGIDLGGTNVRVAKVDEEGTIIKDVIRPSRSFEGPEVITDNIIEAIKEFDLNDIEGIGFAIPGPVDTAKNVITMATNIPGCENYPFAEKIAKATDKKVYLDNDANVAGLAEAMLGAGKGMNVVYYITHSTGIGGALVVGGKVVAGHKGYGGEIANLIVDPSAKRFDHYSHLNTGAVESVASGYALGLFGEEKLGSEMNTAEKIFEAMENGNEQAKELVDKMADDLATAMSYISCIVAPDCIVVGGGVSHASDLYFDRMIASLRTKQHEGMREIPVKKAELKEPGVVGAAMLVRSQL